MNLTVFVIFVFGSFLHLNESLIENLPSVREEGLLSRSNGSTGTLNSENGNFVCKLIISSKMPKRARSSTAQKSKKSRHSSGKSPVKRNPVPRSCKNTPVSRKGIVDFNFLSLPSNKLNMNMGSHQSKRNEKTRDVKTLSDDSASNDELDVVYDLQEEKKNKIYEVITVMSDDETPNQISYERIYADDPAKRVVDESEVKELLSKVPTPSKTNFNENDIVGEIVKEANFIKDKAASVKKSENEGGIIKIDDSVVAINTDTKDDSDSEVICVAVVDSKTKAEQKRQSVEEIYLSSDSDSETGLPKISPLRLKIPYSSYPYVNKYPYYRGSNESENSYSSNYSNFGSNTSNFSFPQNLMFSKPARIYPYIYNSNNNPSDLDSSSSHSKASSLDFSPAASESPKALAADDSSSSALSDSSQHQQNFSPRSVSSDDKTSNSSTPSVCSDDEEKDIYWKADRESRRKADLRYEEFTDYGKKIHEGEIDLDVNTTFTFKVMSYNVLAQTLLEGHVYLYKNHDRRALGWAKRWALIYEEIKDENPEILCLQEVDTAHLATHYAKLLDLGYRWVYKKRTNKNQDGVAVFYKAAVFDAEAHSQVEFYQPGVSVLDRDNVGVVLRLRLNSAPSHAIVVATTHLLYNPRRSDVRLAQVQLLLAEIDRLAFNKEAHTYYPVILTGDFNLKPHNGVYQLLTEGRLQYEGTSRRDLLVSSPTERDSNTLPRTLLPWRLGVTDRCQHVDVLEARVRGEYTSTTRLYNSDHNRSPLQDGDNLYDCSKDDRFESGTLYHGFNFKSVYPHWGPDGHQEASTHHESWVTVDYIFYSTKDGPGSEAAPLQLLSRLRLPTQDECERFIRHLPNFAFGSDHLPLVAKFLLRLQYPAGHHQTTAVPSTSLATGCEAKPMKLSPSTDSLEARPRHGAIKHYSRQFLISCAFSIFAQMPPKDWDQIIKECPAIAKKESNGVGSTQSDSPTQK